MNLLYVTDLHGCEWKYARLLDIAEAMRAEVVINGGDMLPKEGDLHTVQRDFIDRFLPGHFDSFNTAGIQYLCCLGNDDLAAYDERFGDLCSRYPLVHNMAQRKVDVGGYEFLGFNLVADYPFRLKDRCRMDMGAHVFQPQLGTGLLSRDNGFDEIQDWVKYAGELPTLVDELERLASPSNEWSAVYSIHMPPAGVGLDVCANGFQAGSRAVLDMLKKRQPLLSLHGHIHESPSKSGRWKERIGDTVCVQPGQETDLIYVAADLEKMTIERHCMPR